MSQCTCADPMAVSQAVSKVESAISDGDDAIKQQIADSSKELDETLYGSALTPAGKHGAPAPVRFCHWAAPEVTDIGENGWSMAFKAAAVAIAVANGIAQAEISDKQQDLAESYYGMAKYKWDRFKSYYVPLELKLLNEVSTTPIRNIDCVGAESRALISVNSSYGGINGFVSRKAKALRLCIDDTSLAMLDFRRVLMSVDAENFNLVDEQWYTDFKNDQRWNRRSNILNLGRNLSSEALKYGDVARALFGQVGGQIERAAGGVMQALGYYGARNDTYYPTTYLNSGSGNIVNIGAPVSANPAASGNVNPEM